MNATHVQCPLCFTLSPVTVAGAEVICSGCERPFVPVEVAPTQNAGIPYARVLTPGTTSKSDAPPAGPLRPRRVREREDESDDRPQPRRRRRRDEDDDEPVKQSNPVLVLVLIAGGGLALVAVGVIAAVGVALLAKPSSDITIATWQSWPTQNAGGIAIVNPQPDPPQVMNQPDLKPPPTRPIEEPKVERPGWGALRPWGKLEPNSNALVTKYKAKLESKASSQWANWPVTHLLDDKESSSWYSSSPDNTINQVLPWVMFTFPEDVSVKRVTILGNRDPEYPGGYIVTDGRIELLDADGKLISEHTLLGVGDKFDFDLRLAKPTAVRAIRFTMTKSQNGQCGLGEFQVE